MSEVAVDGCLDHSGQRAALLCNLVNVGVHVQLPSETILKTGSVHITFVWFSVRLLFVYNTLTRLIGRRLYSVPRFLACWRLSPGIAVRYVFLFFFCSGAFSFRTFVCSMFWLVVFNILRLLLFSYSVICLLCFLLY